ncbi:Flp pilus assembly protein CpaB [Arthrobacter sp. 35W]|uniref:Flp pilus assembly protein CpaB n=1 Tax=Arthrobacter sp. 35W TaxID=1132441 RepID=UPI0009DEE2CF|nr:Flp pilus assembly protein CpaB [Arthrobacter sp. 35W]
MKSLGRTARPLWPDQQRPSSAAARAAPGPLRSLRRLVLRRRRLLAALLFCAAAALAVAQLTPAPLALSAVVVAERDLGAGTTLAGSDLGYAQLPPDAVPSAAYTTVESLVGRQLAGPLRRGQFLTDASLLGAGLLVGAPPGSQAVPIRLADPATVGLLSEGQLVDVVLSSTTGAADTPANELLARAVPVLWTADAPAQGVGLMPAGEADGLIVVAAGPEDALRLAGASARGKIFLVLVGAPP